MEREIESKINSALEMFCENISKKYNLNKWNLYSLYKWGFSYDEIKELKDDDVFLYVFEKDKSYAKINKKTWEIYVD